MSPSPERSGGVDRFDAALYTVAEAARYLDVPDSTLAHWTHGYRQRGAGRREVIGEAVLTALPRTGPRSPVIPFIGLAEGVVLTAMRRSGVPLQRIRPALVRLEEQVRARARVGQQAPVHRWGRGFVRLRRERG